MTGTNRQSTGRLAAATALLRYRSLPETAGDYA
jgi:hypothetical protein